MKFIYKNTNNQEYVQKKNANKLHHTRAFFNAYKLVNAKFKTS